MLRPWHVWANSRHIFTSTTLPHSRRMLSLPSFVQIIINELQSLEKNREFYLKIANSNNKKSKLNTTTKEHRSSLHFIELFFALVLIFLAISWSWMTPTEQETKALQHNTAPLLLQIVVVVPTIKTSWAYFLALPELLSQTFELHDTIQITPLEFFVSSLSLLYKKGVTSMDRTSLLKETP